jgi:hypothetical protein
VALSDLQKRVEIGGGKCTYPFWSLGPPFEHLDEDLLLVRLSTIHLVRLVPFI